MGGGERRSKLGVWLWREKREKRPRIKLLYDGKKKAKSETKKGAL